MIPLVDDWLIHLREQRHASMISASHVGFGDTMATRRDTHRDALNGKILGGDLDEVEIDVVAERPPSLYTPPVHCRRQGRLEGKALAETLSIRESAQELTAAATGCEKAASSN